MIVMFLYGVEFLLIFKILNFDGNVFFSDFFYVKFYSWYYIFIVIFGFWLNLKGNKNWFNFMFEKEKNVLFMEDMDLFIVMVLIREVFLVFWRLMSESFIFCLKNKLVKSN